MVPLDNDAMLLLASTASTDPMPSLALTVSSALVPVGVGRDVSPTTATATPPPYSRNRNETFKRFPVKLRDLMLEAQRVGSIAWTGTAVSYLNVGLGFMVWHLPACEA